MVCIATLKERSRSQTLASKDGVNGKLHKSKLLKIYTHSYNTGLDIQQARSSLEQ